MNGQHRRHSAVLNATIDKLVELLKPAVRSDPERMWPILNAAREKVAGGMEIGAALREAAREAGIEVDA